MAIQISGELIAAIVAAFGAFIMLFLVLGIAIYIFTAFCLMKIANRKNVPNAWLAFVPIAQLWVVLKVANLHWAWMFILLIGIVPMIGQLLGLIGMIYIAYKFLEGIKQPWWWLLIMFLVPLFGYPIALGYFAFGVKD